MKSIELTKDHKSKLLEMCEVLFPEYPEVVMTTDYFMEETGEIEFRNWTNKNHLNWTTTKPIHWFEFCMEICQKLATTNSMICFAIQTNFNYVTVHYKFWNDDFSKIHPVDYLYEEFLKLKL